MKKIIILLPAVVLTGFVVWWWAGDSVKMVWIEPGTFTMGSPEDEPGRDDDETQRQVTLTKGFYMSKHPVTQAQYEAVMGENPSYHKGDSLPVEWISWYEAIAFCNKLSIKKRLNPAYRVDGSTDPRDWRAAPEIRFAVVEMVEGSNGYRLPTEAQWEYACRAGTTTAFNTGLAVSDANDREWNLYNLPLSVKGKYTSSTGDATPFNKEPKSNATGWFFHNSGLRTHPVGGKPANAWGLHDMHGNVWEWCWDWYGDYESGAQTDPQGPVSGQNRVRRGGAFNHAWHKIRSANRSDENPLHPNPTAGFRLVRP